MNNAFLNKSLLSLIVLFSILIVACQPFQPNNWEFKIKGIGASSSPRAIDLNQDGIKDIVLGGGAKEYVTTDAGVIAIDGATGELLWKMSARNQVVGSAIFKDITKDGIPDVFIGGRSAIFYAIDGANGNLLWEYYTDDGKTDYFNDPTILNFYAPQFIPDQDKDGLPEILTAYGGFIKATEKDLERPIGSLMILSSATGEVLSRAFVPDGKEIYCSPILHNQNDQITVIFGTGGEYINGHLYSVALQDIIAEDLSNAIVLAEGEGKGFIAPPVLADINEDQIPDIIANSVNGRLIAIDGKTNSPLWEMRMEGDLDTYAMPAPGYFNGNDKIPDFFTSFGKGAWPNTEYTIQALVDGKTGKLILKDTLGTYQYASPVVADLNNDSHHDILLAINTKVTSNLNNSNMRFIGNDLVIYPNGNFRPRLLQKTKLGSNLGSTPLLTDLDDDGNLDIISVYMGDPVNFYSFSNLVVDRIELNIAADNIVWGGYMGQEGSGTFKNN